MKMFFLYIIIAIFSGVLPLAAGQDVAEQPSQQITPDKPATQQLPPVPVPVPQPQHKPKADKNKNWPRPFVPTERINADSAVSLPIDI